MTGSIDPKMSLSPQSSSQPAALPTPTPQEAKVTEVAQVSLSHMEETEEIGNHRFTLQSSDQSQPILLEGSIDRGKAPAFLKKNSEQSGESASVAPRLKLAAGEPFSIRLNRVMKIEDSENLPHVGRVGENAVSFLVREATGIYLVEADVDEMADRLWIKPEKIAKHAERGTLEDFLQNEKQGHLERLPKIAADYQTMFERYFKDNPSNLAGGLNALQILKIIRLSHKAGVAENQSVQFEFRGVNIFAEKIRGKLKLIRMDDKKRLASGSYNTAFRVMRLDKSKSMAFRLSHTAAIYAKRHEADMHDPIEALNMQVKAATAAAENRKGAQILKEIHKDGRVKGIQNPPMSVASFMGPIGSFYQLRAGSGKAMLKSREFRESPLETKLDCCYQILEAGAALAQANWLDTDRKLDNSLFHTVEEEGKMRFILELSDLDGAIRCRPGAGVNFATMTHTKDITPYSDVVDHMFNERTAVYQYGVMIYTLLCSSIDNPESHRPSRADSYVDTDQPFHAESLQQAGVGKNTISALERICFPIPQLRPTANEAKELFKAAIQADEYLR